MATKVQGSRRRSKRGYGRLYKRGPDGKEYPASSKVRGAFWLEFRADGRRVRQPLKDEDGVPITTLRKAEQERERVVAPFLARDKAEALRQVVARLDEAERVREGVESESSRGVLLRDMWQAFLDTMPDTGPTTLNEYRKQIARFVRWAEDAYPNARHMRDIDREVARGFANYLKAEGVSRNTFGKYITLLARLWSILAEDGRMDENPWTVWKGKGPVKDRGGTGRRELTRKELKAICESAKGELRLLFVIGIYTGLRLGDCATLRWTEVNLARNQIVRAPNKTRRSKPNKVVTVPIHPVLRAMLEEVPEEGRRGYVLPATAKQYHGRVETLNNAIQRHFETNGIRTHKPGTGGDTGTRAVVEVGFHSLRHSFVSLCREADAPLAVVEAIVGHSNPAMTRHYTHIGEAAATTALASLPALIGDRKEGESVKGKKRSRTLKEYREREDQIAELLQCSSAETWESDRRRALKILERI